MAHYYEEEVCETPYNNTSQMNAKLTKAQSYAQSQGIGSTNSADSLATIAPRVIRAAHELTQLAAHLEGSFGISRPQKESERPPTAPTLMSQLQEMEHLLSFSLSALNNVNQHVNGG